MFLWFCDGRKMRKIHIAEGFDEEYFDKVYVKNNVFLEKYCISGRNMILL